MIALNPLNEQSYRKPKKVSPKNDHGQYHNVIHKSQIVILLRNTFSFFLRQTPDRSLNVSHGRTDSIKSHEYWRLTSLPPSMNPESVFFFSFSFLFLLNLSVS